MKIPEDIMVRAEAAYDALGRGSDADAQVIARAILAERRRCAEAARSWQQTATKLGQVTEADMASDIAQAIEAGE